jgi:hypothetical protein
MPVVFADTIRLRTESWIDRDARERKLAEQIVGS